MVIPRWWCYWLHMNVYGNGIPRKVFYLSLSALVLADHVYISIYIYVYIYTIA